MVQPTQGNELATQVLRDVRGRTLNNTNDSYMLPADLAEHNRLNVQHEMLKSAVGGLYLAPQAIQRVLSPRTDGSVPRVLDIGTGSGTWAVDMANEFPHAEVTGLDLAPVNPFSKPPSNCQFILGDCNTWLDDPSHQSSFDVIQARCVITGIADYRKFLWSVLKALRPGGVLLVIEGRLACFNENRQHLGVQVEGEKAYSWQHNLVSRALEAMTARNIQISYLDDIPSFLGDMGDVWEDVRDQPIWVPIGPWNQDSSELIFQGDSMRMNCLKFTESVQPLLISGGHTEAQVQKWTENARKELEEVPFKQWSKWGGVWAVKRNDVVA